MSKTAQNGDIGGEIRDTRLADALSERYLSYALSTIMSRSLPDVRDGLKPVHRRLLFAMQQLKLDPKSGFKKCARVVGDVMGKYHPHGDMAIYDAMVRLSQDFAVRYPLVDGQGNFGNIDGDNAAAMRYTEARMTDVAMNLLDGIGDDTVDFRATYDGEEEEPVVLPANFPNLLANGAAGIAVGMATSIPPHNVGELCDALKHLIKFPNATIDKLVEFIPGPDFPTGGEMVENRDTVVEAYKTGRGGFRVRAKWETEDLGRGTYQIVVTEIPYQVQKSKLIEKIAEIINNKKLPILTDVRDESAEDIRIVLEPRTGKVEAEMLMEQLYRLTDLENRFSLNMNVLDADNTPRVMTLREVLRAYLDHRMVVLERRSQNRLGQIERRLEVLGGMLIAFLNLDEVIRIIREEDHPKQEMIKAFKLTDVQAEAILNMRLRQLRKLEEMEIRTENDALKAEQAELQKLLADEKLRWTSITEEINTLKTNYGQKTEIGARRTSIGEAPTAVVVPLEAMIEREPITVVCSEKGWVRGIKGHLTADQIKDLKYKEGDKGRFAIVAQTTDKLLVFATNGRFYTLACDKLPGGRGHGEPLRLMFELPNDADITTMLVHQPGRKLIVASDSGHGFIVLEDEVLAQTKNGKQILNVGAGAEAATCSIVPEGADSIAAIGSNRKIVIFPLAEMPEMTRGKGVILQRYKKGGGAVLNDVKAFKLDEGLSFPFGSGWRTETDLMRWQGKRAGAGAMAPRGFPRPTSSVEVIKVTQYGDRGTDTGRSSASTPYKVDDLFQYLEGTWQFERKVHDSFLGQEGDCIGVAQFYAADHKSGDTNQLALDYQEEGTLTMGEIETATERSYLYHFPAPSMAEVRFTDGRFFHLLDLTKGMVRVDHECGDDMYHGVFRVLAPDAWLAVWRVKGPRKDQVITTRYIRAIPS